MSDLWTGATVQEAAGLAARLGLDGEQASVPIGNRSAGEQQRQALAVAVDVEAQSVIEVWRPLADACRQEPFVPILTTVIEDGPLSVELWLESDQDPEEVVAAAVRWTGADLDAALDAHMVRQWSGSDPDELERELGATRDLLGAAPDPSLIPAGLSGAALERWLYGWEDEHGADPEPSELTYEPYFPMAVVFLPIVAPWQVAAVQGQFGVDPVQAAARLRRWSDTHGAEVVVMDGTHIHVAVERPAADADEAWRLACEHDALGPGALFIVGSPLRWAARALRVADTWTMWSKP